MTSTPVSATIDAGSLPPPRPRRDAGTVEVHAHSVGVGAVTEVGDLVGRVDGAHLGRLADRHHGRLRVVLAVEPRDVRVDVVRHQLAVRCRDGDQLRPGEAGRRAALVDDDVRAVGGDHRLPRLQQRREPDDVRAGPAPAQVGGDLTVEELVHGQLGPAGPRVLAVGEGRPVVGPADRLDHIGRGAGGVVAGEGVERRGRRGVGDVGHRRTSLPDRDLGATRRRVAPGRRCGPARASGTGRGSRRKDRP